jgi:hypothetical protein
MVAPFPLLHHWSRAAAIEWMAPAIATDCSNVNSGTNKYLPKKAVRIDGSKRCMEQWREKRKGLASWPRRFFLPLLVSPIPPSLLPLILILLALSTFCPCPSSNSFILYHPLVLSKPPNPLWKIHFLFVLPQKCWALMNLKYIVTTPQNRCIPTTSTSIYLNYVHIIVLIYH